MTTSSLQKTVFITGGHLTPALAVIEEIRNRKLPWHIVFVGRIYAKEGDTHKSSEFTLVTSRAIQFLSLTAGRVSRFISIGAFFSVCKIPVGFLQALTYVYKYKPSMIISFGGYVAVPVVVAGWLLGVPSVTHEQTRSVGLANSIIGFFAKKIFVSHKEQVVSQKHIYVGLPLRNDLFLSHVKPAYIPSLSLPLLYITGGVTGALSLNDRIFPVIPRLVEHFFVVHQVGHDSLIKAEEVKKNLSPSNRSKYSVHEYINAKDVGWILQHAKIVIGRSGANICGELEALGVVSILVPLPWSAKQEQAENARYLVSKGTAVVLDQTGLTSQRVEETLERVMKEYDTYARAAKDLAQVFPRDASQKMVSMIETVMP